MNEKLYDSDAYIKEFTSDVVSIRKITWKKEEVFELVLERTCFFPEQGGQESDTGKLYVTDSDICFDVFHAYIKDDVIYHLARMTGDHDEQNYSVSEKEICSGRKISVKGIINWEERFDKMQNHSGEHLVSGTVHRFFGYDNVGFSLTENNCTLDFNGLFSEEDIIFIEKTVNRAVFENIRTRVWFPSKEELEGLEYRSKKELTGRVRIVEYPGYDICACCAPHVDHTGEIGLIKIVSAEHFKGGTRMSIKCGYRALDDYGFKLASSRNISRKLSVTIDEVYNGVEKLYEDCQKARFGFNNKTGQILELMAQNVICDRNPCVFIEEADLNIARSAVNKMVKKSDGYCGIFVGNDVNGYSFIISSTGKNCKELLESLKKQCGVKGGGNESMIQGSTSADENSIKKAVESVGRTDESKIILASASPRRKEILEKLGIEFEIQVSGCDENINIKDPGKLVIELSKAKASDVAARNNGKIVIGADTVVAYKGEIMGKPVDRKDAVRMIRSYSGDVHQVFTGVSIAVPSNIIDEKKAIPAEIVKDLESKTYELTVCDKIEGYLIFSYYVSTDVHVLAMTDQEIERYVDTGETSDKAGAYAIQGKFAPFIESINGDYYNVVGLPVYSVYSVIRHFL